MTTSNEDIDTTMDYLIELVRIEYPLGCNDDDCEYCKLNLKPMRSIKDNIMCEILRFLS